MTLANFILDAIRARLGKPPLREGRTYGPPGKVLTDRHNDFDAASHDIAHDLDTSFPDAFTARIKSGFEPNRDYEGERKSAMAEMSAELERTWEAGKPYSSWVSDAARRAGI